MTKAEFLSKIDNADPADTDLFHEIVRLSESVLELTDLDFAREFTTSRSTFARWKSGVNAPHVKMRPHVYAFLMNRCRQ